MLEKVPTEEELNQLMEEDVFKTWCSINNFIKDNYDMDMLWDNGGNILIISMIILASIMMGNGYI